MSEIFDRFARRFGGAYDPQSNQNLELTRFIQSCHGRSLDHIRLFCPYAATYQLESGLSSNGEFNARAGIEAETGIDCVGIYLGFSHIIRDLFYVMLGRREILPHIGNSNDEIGSGYYNAQIIEVDLESFTPLPRPRNIVRYQYAFKLHYLAFHWMFQHEFGHIFNGHADWLNKHFGFKALGERGLSTIERANLDIQTLEMDADCFAIIDVLGGALHANFDAKDRSRPPVIPTRNHFGSPRDAIFAVLFAVYSVFRIFAGDEDLSDDDMFSVDHPPGIYRQQFFFELISEFIRRHNVIPLPAFAQIFSDAIVEAEEAFAVLMGTSPLRAPQFTVPYERGIKLRNRLLANLDTLKLELQPLQCGRELGP